VRRILATLSLALVAAGALAEAAGAQTVVRYVRYMVDGRVAYGIVDGDRVRELAGDLFAGPTPTGRTVALGAVTILPVTSPSKVIAVGLNYRSHSGMSGAGAPGLFAKLPSSLVATGQPIVIPRDSGGVHYEGELVVVVGKRARNVAEADVPAHIFGVTAGNDVSERTWQGTDLQWLRAKASDSFGPVGPYIATGLNYNDLLLTTRVNGKVVQQERTSMLIHSIAKIVSYTSRYVTLEPGDLIFTGTPGRTENLNPGDVVEVEVEGVGVLRNPVVKEK
jgi:2-keto-4-pentenoate hydratase/2-oxohepta-3-ene-1,7-dioic acid hydratase in catechol pathway